LTNERSGDVMAKDEAADMGCGCRPGALRTHPTLIPAVHHRACITLGSLAMSRWLLGAFETESNMARYIEIRPKNIAISSLFLLAPSIVSTLPICFVCPEHYRHAALLTPQHGPALHECRRHQNRTVPQCYHLDITHLISLSNYKKKCHSTMTVLNK